jgi:tetratricopeptide (TPR) repeat protein
MTPGEYLVELQSEAILGHESLQGVDLRVSPTNHELHVGRTFALSYERLRPAEATEALALALLARATYFAPEPTPRELLLLTTELPDRAARRRANRALKRLGELGLLEEEEGRLVVHRLVARFVREVNQESQAQAAVEAALQAEARRINNAGYPEPLLRWQAHLRWLTEAALEREDERAAELGNSLGYHLDRIGDYAGARPYYERALVIKEKVLGPEHSDTALGLNNLGSLLQAMGDYAGARPYYERALAIREKVLGPEHPDTASSLNNLGSLLKAMGDYAGARPYYEQALKINEKVLGPEHPNTRIVRGNLAGLEIGDWRLEIRDWRLDAAINL